MWGLEGGTTKEDSFMEDKERKGLSRLAVLVIVLVGFFVVDALVRGLFSKPPTCPTLVCDTAGLDARIKELAERIPVVSTAPAVATPDTKKAAKADSRKKGAEGKNTPAATEQIAQREEKPRKSLRVVNTSTCTIAIEGMNLDGTENREVFRVGPGVDRGIKLPQGSSMMVLKAKVLDGEKVLREVKALPFKFDVWEGANRRQEYTWVIGEDQAHSSVSGGGLEN